MSVDLQNAVASFCLGRSSRHGIGACPSTLLLPLLAVVLVAASLLAQQPDSLLNQGIAAMQRGDFAAAEVAFRAAVDLNPKSARAWKALGVSFAARGLHDQASEPFAKACNLDRNEPDACYYAARNHYLLNRFAESLAMFDTLAKAHGTDWRYANGRGLALMALSRYAEAESAFQTAIRAEQGSASPDEAPAVNLGSLYSRAGEPEKALHVLQAFVQSRRAGARAWFELGKVQVQRSRLEEAIAALEQAVQVNPSHREAHLLLAKVYARLGNTAKAEHHRSLGQQFTP